jgi:DNA-binding NarL/FixJ family response regulator
MSTLRIVVADDHLLVRAGVVALLGTDPGVEVVAEAADAGSLREAVEVHRPDAVLTDIRMPPGHGVDGITVAVETRRRHPGTGVVVLSQHLERAYVLRLFAEGTGGLGYLLKDRVGDRAELLRALRETAAGGSVLDPQVVEAAVTGRASSAALDRLAPREREVLELMAEGLSNPAVAARLHVSLSSVEKAVSAIFTKLDLPEAGGTNRRVSAVLELLRST